ncbi:uncharacterized protein LOC100890361 [Strongylocentrotus purpuratus]|uniref:Uncharacterized protein n=1 Tax=Strongylocentrotus purpuratus TaxID=7668 RepID=A0A7M7N2L5_STRPU|nr:uncharacterized protein LOC100890361 [Strongylocentrotus purpuratus]XP_030829734.1 uncharacterized protein LOC100890361 [Strongylocentrotus purpuratus]|eukprot:XP_003727385.1 PREDICTED: uncharacterized protein LOC100890361 [Strongylocentrotus purpuratus]
MMVKPVKKRAIQEWKLTEAIQPKEKVPEPTPKALMNHIEYPRVSQANLLTQAQASVMHHSHPFHIPPPGVMIPGDPRAAMRNHYVEPMYIHPQSIPRSTGPPNVIIRPPERQSHPRMINPSDITGLPGRGAKRPQMPQDMAAVEAKASRKRRKPEGTTEFVMSPFLNGSVNGSVHINEKVPPIQPIILDFEVPLPPLSPHPDERMAGPRGDGGGGERKVESHGAQAMSPVHSPAREDDHRHPRHAGGADRHSSKSGSGNSTKNSLFKKPDINHYKSSTQTGGTRCFICQNSIIPNTKDYPVAPSGLVICTKCRVLAKSGSPVAVGPPPKIQIPGRSSHSRSQPQQRIPRSPVAKSPAASLTLPRSPLPRSPSSRSPAPSSPLPNSSPSSPANTLSAPNSPASTSGLSVPGSPRYSAPNSPRYSAPSSPRNSAPSSPVSRPPGSPLPKHPSIVVSRSPYMNSSYSQPPSPRPMEYPSGRRHSISGTHLEVHVGSGASKASPTGSIGAGASPRPGSAADSPASMENLQLPPGREGDDTTIRALLQLGRMKADSERRTVLQGTNRALDQGELRLPRTLADISRLDQAQLLELQHRLRYAGLPSRCYQQEFQGSPNHDDTGTRNSKGHHLPKSSLSPNSVQSVLQLPYQGNGPPLIRSEGVVGTALPITALPSTTEDAPLKISRVIRSAQEHDSIDHRRSHSPSDPQLRMLESLESLRKTGQQCGASQLEKYGKYYKKNGSKASATIDMFRDQYSVFQCHCSSTEVFFIKCPDCDFICNSIFGMELHIAAQRHGEVRGPPPPPSRDADYACDEQSCKESRADSEASHSSFETQSADTEAEGSGAGSPPRTAQMASPNVYSPLPNSIPEAWREQVASRMRLQSGVVDLGSTVPHVNIPRPMAQGLGEHLRPHHGPTELPSPLDLSGKRSAEQSLLEHRERSGSRERRSHESNGPLDLSGYKHIQTPNSQFVSSQRLGSVGSVIEKSMATSVPSLALSQAVSQITPGMPAMAVPGMSVPGMMLATANASQPPYPIPTMLYPLSTLAGTIPLLTPIHFQSASAPPSPNYSRHLESSQPRRASCSLAPPTEIYSKSASPSPSMSSPQEQSRQTLSVPQQLSSHPSQGPRAKALSYQGGTITIQPSASSLSSSTNQKTVTLESQFSRSSPATPQGPPHSPQTPMPSSPAPLLSSTVQTPSVWVKSEPQSDEEMDRDNMISRLDKDKDTPNCQNDISEKNDGKGDKAKSIEQKDIDAEKEKEKEKELEKFGLSTKIPTSSSSNRLPPVQIKNEPEN